ncbi:hypothetical protein RRG08_019480, partial [Elysia crispata]
LALGPDRFQLTLMKDSPGCVVGQFRPVTSVYKEL